MNRKKTKQATSTVNRSRAGNNRLPFANRSLTIARLKRLLRPVFEKKGIIKAFLFGSYARGTQDIKSDIDLLIIKNTDKRFLDRFEEFMEIHTLLKHHAIDLLIYSPDEVERNGHRPFIKNILTGGVTLYER